MLLERRTNPKHSRRACTCECGLQSSRGESARVAKRPRELISPPPETPPSFSYTTPETPHVLVSQACRRCTKGWCARGATVQVAGAVQHVHPHGCGPRRRVVHGGGAPGHAGGLRAAARHVRRHVAAPRHVRALPTSAPASVPAAWRVIRKAADAVGAAREPREAARLPPRKQTQGSGRIGS
jgi:hypothetical protein